MDILSNTISQKSGLLYLVVWGSVAGGGKIKVVIIYINPTNNC